MLFLYETVYVDFVCKASPTCLCDTGCAACCSAQADSCRLGVMLYTALCYAGGGARWRWSRAPRQGSAGQLVNSWLPLGSGYITCYTYQFKYNNNNNLFFEYYFIFMLIYYYIGVSIIWLQHSCCTSHMFQVSADAQKEGLES